MFQVYYKQIRIGKPDFDGFIESVLGGLLEGLLERGGATKDNSVRSECRIHIILS